MIAGVSTTAAAYVVRTASRVSAALLEVQSGGMGLTISWLDEVLDNRSAILASVTSYPLEGGQVAMRGWMSVEV